MLWAFGSEKAKGHCFSLVRQWIQIPNEADRDIGLSARSILSFDVVAAVVLTAEIQNQALAAASASALARV